VTRNPFSAKATASACPERSRREARAEDALDFHGRANNGVGELFVQYLGHATKPFLCHELHEFSLIYFLFFVVIREIRGGNQRPLCHELHEFSLILLLCHELHEFSLILLLCHELHEFSLIVFSLPRITRIFTKVFFVSIRATCPCVPQGKL